MVNKKYSRTQSKFIDRFDNISKIGSNLSTIVIDFDLLINIYVDRNIFGLRRKKYVISSANVIHADYIRRRQDYFDVVIVVITGKDLKYKKWLYDSVLRYPYQLVVLEDEDSYKNWIKIQNPDEHLTIAERRYYHRNSIYINDVVKYKK